MSHAGDRSWQKMEKETRQLAQLLGEFLQTDRLEPFAYDFQLHGFHLKGTIEEIYSCGLIRFRPATIKIKDRLRIWLEQLILQHCSAQYPPHALLVGIDADKNKLPEFFTTSKIDTPKQYLEVLLECYKEGLKRPFAFFPESAQEYMEKWLQGKTEMARERASKKWYSQADFSGEMARNPYFKRCFSHLDLIAETDFERNTVIILHPVFFSPESGFPPDRFKKSVGGSPPDRLKSTVGRMIEQEFDLTSCPLQGLKLIEASAGTGKTFAIVGIYLRLLMEKFIPVEKILVVTFTEAATAELKVRISDSIQHLLSALQTGITEEPLFQHFFGSASRWFGRTAIFDNATTTASTVFV